MFAFSFLFHSFSVACLLVGIYITEPNAGVGGGPAVTRIRHLYVKKKKKYISGAKPYLVYQSRDLGRKNTHHGDIDSSR